MEDFARLTTGADALRLNVARGDIEVSASPDGGWQLQWSPDDAGPPEVYRVGNSIVVRQRPGADLRTGLDIKAQVPRELQTLELQTGMGRVSVVGVQGRLVLNSAHGGISLQSAGGEAQLATANGEIAVMAFGGDLSCATGNGRTRLESITGRARVQAGNGRVELLDSDARIRSTAGNGDVVASGLAGEVQLTTGHGQVTVTGSRSLAVRATSAAGEVRVEGGSVRELRASSMTSAVRCSAQLEAGGHELSSSMGDVVLELQPVTSARIDAQTSFGQVQSDFPLVRVGRSGPMGFGGVRMVGSIGEGEQLADISLRSSKGQIVIRRVADRDQLVAQPDPQPAPPPAADVVSTSRASPGPAAWTPLQAPVSLSQSDERDTTLQILEAVARGEVTPEDAERLLGAAAS